MKNDQLFGIGKSGNPEINDLDGKIILLKIFFAYGQIVVLDIDTDSECERVSQGDDAFDSRRFGICELSVGAHILTVGANIYPVFRRRVPYIDIGVIDSDTMRTVGDITGNHGLRNKSAHVQLGGEQQRNCDSYHQAKHERVSPEWLDSHDNVSSFEKTPVSSAGFMPWNRLSPDFSATDFFIRHPRPYWRADR